MKETYSEYGKKEIKRWKQTAKFIRNFSVFFLINCWRFQTHSAHDGGGGSNAHIMFKLIWLSKSNAQPFRFYRFPVLSKRANEEKLNLSQIKYNEITLFRLMIKIESNIKRQLIQLERMQLFDIFKAFSCLQIAKLYFTWTEQCERISKNDA